MVAKAGEGGGLTRLYLITPQRIDLATFPETLARALDAGDVAALQLRLKNPDGAPAPDDEILRAGKILVPFAQGRGVAVILNDRPDLAKALGADGVHLGQEDAPYAEARRLLGPDAMIGVTCHNSRHLAIEAAEAGADYVAFGAIYPTSTKDTRYTADLDLIAWWAEIMETPCVAIGGITVENAEPVARAGADFLAVMGGVWNHAEGPEAAIRELTELLAKLPA